MVDEDLKNKMKDLLGDGSFSAQNLAEYFQFFTQVCNENEDVKDLVKKWKGEKKVIGFNLEGLGVFSLKYEGDTFTFTEGEQEADLKLAMEAEVAAKIFTGEKDAVGAYMTKELKIEIGDTADALKFKQLVETVKDTIA